MDVLAPPPVASAPTTSTVGTPPRLGTPVPGTTGGLPALGGLSVNASPMAQQLQSAGRGQDSMLVHMTPAEVNSLQGLAMAHGGSLTINPQTGLPEAGFLSRILPTLLGAGLTFIPGIGPLAAAGIVGLGTGAVTGDIGKGLMAGLGAFGGASLAGALAPAATGTSLAAEAGTTAAQKAAEQAITKPLAETAQIAANPVSTVAPAATDVAGAYSGLGAPMPFTPTIGAVNVADYAALQAGAPQAFVPTAAKGLASAAVKTAATSAAAPPASTNILTNFGRAARNALPQGTPGIVSRAAPMLAGYGMVAPLMQPYNAEFPEQEEEDYTVPQYRLRSVYPRIPEGPAYNRDNYLGETQWFDPAGFQRMAEGDEVPAPAPGGLGSLGASLPEYVKMFQTSPGAITGVPYGYGVGQSPTELIRAQVAATPAPPAAIAPTASPIAATPSFGSERDYGLMKSAPKSNPMSLYGDDYGYVGDYGYPSNGFDYLRGYAHGGSIEMESGGFVMPARETAEFGNGSTEAGQRRLAAMGGMPIRGRGDGTSDSIRARIDGTQQARLADGETYFPPRAVERMGGADKLRAMMNKATKSRQQAARGGDNKLKGLV